MVDETRFASIIKENERIIFKITTVYTNNSDDQKDLYQDIVIQLWKAYGSFRNESKLSTWLYRVALNTAITRLRKEKRTGIKVPIDQVVLNHTESHDPELEDRLRDLYQSIEMLSELDKGIVLLFLEEKSYEEIAEITGMTVSNVGTRLNRIKKKLKQQMSNSKLSA